MRFAFGRKAAAALALASALTLGGCYDGYGYGGVSAGYGLYDDGYYGAPYAGLYGGGIGPGYGWYDGFYYPGSGYYIYDRGGARHRWNDNQRRYWEGRRAGIPRDGRWNGRPGRPDGGQWAGRPDRPGDGRWNRPGRPDGGWRDRADRPNVFRPDGTGWARPARPSADIGRARRGEGAWGAFSRSDRARALGGRGGGARQGRTPAQ